MICEVAWSSRPPRTGSIAAARTATGPWSMRPVVPSAKDGLHCGKASSNTKEASCRVVPSAKDGLHCGGCHLYGHLPGGTGRPVRQGRAPLRQRDHHHVLVHSGGRPVRQGRAPLRQQPGRRPGGAGVRSSRPPRTGSIAALTSSTRWWPRPRSSRPPRTGSIAAWPCAATSPVQPHRRPVRQGRAPLRRVMPHRHEEPADVSSRPPRTGSIAALGLQLGATRWSSRPVRQGRAPLRPWTSGCGDATPSRSSRPPRTGSIAAPQPLCGAQNRCHVVPSAKDGLHCGASMVRGQVRQIMRSSRPPRTGSIAANSGDSCGSSGWECRPVRQGRAPLRPARLPGARSQDRGRRPVRQGRAPLRPLLRQRVVRGGGAVVPSAKDGLHCGPPGSSGSLFANARSSRPPRTGSIAAMQPTPSSRRPRCVVPSAKDGLHCGSTAPAISRRRCSVVPSAKDGLHCGRNSASRSGQAWSRPVRQGRAPLRLWGAMLIGAYLVLSSRPPRTGSIAANRRTFYLRKVATSSRPPRTGSIAAPCP